LADITIPPTFQPGLLSVRDLTDQQVQAILAALSQIEPSTNYAEIASRTVSVLDKQIVGEQTTDVLRAVASLYDYRSYSGKSVAETVAEVSGALEHPDDDGRRPLLAAADVERYANKLRQLLSADRLFRHFKVRRLAVDAYSTFSTARIITDIRPIFDAERITQPTGAIVIHTLKLEYWQENSKELYLLLDEDDIATLKKALDRATEKSKALKNFIRATKTEYVGG
jgi:hypothetical protein